MSSLHVSESSAPSPKKFQLCFNRPAQMALFAKIVSYPPLSQVTVIPPNREAINFIVILESSKTFPERPWETSIWYDQGGLGSSKDPWRALELKKVDASPVILSTESSDKLFRYSFAGTIPSPFTDPNKTYKGRKVRFTIRFREGAEGPWQWVRDQFGRSDGELILQSPIDPNIIAEYPMDLKPGWFVRKLSSEVPDARLYSLESTKSIPNGSSENTKTEMKVLGKVAFATRFFALVRIWSPWLAPRHGGEKFNITEDAMMCSFLCADGFNVVLLAVNGVDDILTLFKSNEEGEIVVAARNDSGKDGKFRVIAAVARDFEMANAAAMYEMRKVVRHSGVHKLVASHLPTRIKAESPEAGFEVIANSKINGAIDNPAPAPEWLTSWYDSLSYCTWNSLGQDLNIDKIMSGLQSLADNDIHVATLIIDDNWQDLDGKQGDTAQTRRGWKSFEANPQGFPDGLKAATTKIREKFPAIRDIAVWHALLGYWGGISPDGVLAKKYKTIELEKGADDKILAIHPDAIHDFYNDCYSFLSSAGVTGVKTDAQFMLDLISQSPQRRALMFPFQSAWTQAHLTHLGGRAISCMSMIPQILFHSFLPTNTPRIMLRNSDDFFPDIPESHPWHVFCNAHNALLVQHLNVLPDWDMFQTSHPYSGFHAAARCVSGGPIYITDTPGQHDVGLIKQMTAKNTRGETVILRPSCIGKSVGIYDNYNEGHLLRIGVYDGKAGVGTGMLGVFNISNHEISYLLPITDFPAVRPHGDKKWIIRSHVTEKLTEPICPVLPVKAGMLIQQTLEVRGYDIWSAVPVHTFTMHSKPVDVAVLGLLGKMAGACAILSSTLAIEGSARLKIHVQLKALGILGIWVDGIKARTVDQMMVMIQGKAVPAGRVSIDQEKSVLEVDVEGAWTDMGLDAGWGNEVGVDVYVP